RRVVEVALEDQDRRVVGPFQGESEYVAHVDPDLWMRALDALARRPSRPRGCSSTPLRTASPLHNWHRAPSRRPAQAGQWTADRSDMAFRRRKHDEGDDAGLDEAAVIENLDRVSALYATGLMDTAPRPDLDAVARTAAERLGTPVGLMTLVDA